MRISILGPGGIGGFLAAMLLRAGHEVTVIARPETAAAISAKGLTLESRAFGTFTAHPSVVSSFGEDADVLIIATKAYDLEEALHSILPEAARSGVAIPLLNGFEHIPVLRARFPGRLAPGMISIVAMKKDRTTILHTSPQATIELASSEILPQRLHRIAAAFSEAGIGTAVLASEAAVIWNKFARLAVLAAATAALQKPLGRVRNEDGVFLQELANESAAASEVAGAPVSAEAIMGGLTRLPDDVTTSLSRDVAAGRMGETEAIIGAMIRLLSKNGLSHHAFDRAHELIQARLS